ncbi:MAG TPA: DUF6640 family protein [Thermoanaerobaculia bacterium]|nr:DUF6640 family protein [Thermoanaerobaculia bacterium]
MRRRGAAFWFLNLLAVWTTVNGLAADWNYTHLFNPQWSPHAKYHDAVSIAASIVLGLIGLIYLWRDGARSTAYLEFSMVAQCAFWLSLLLGFTFPGTAETAYEHPEIVPSIGPVRLNEIIIGSSGIIFTLIAWTFEKRRRDQETNRATTMV